MTKGTIIKIIGVIISIFLSIYFPIRLGDPEFGYKYSKPILGKNLAKLLFPIGEASIIDPVQFVEILPFGWEGTEWEGRGDGDYRFWVLNEHNRNIRITDFNIMGPSPVTRIFVDSMEVPESVAEHVKVEIAGYQIKPPIGVIVGKDASENIEIPLEVRYDITILKGAVEEHTSRYISVYGWVQITISYEILGKDIKENISKLVDVHFLLRPPS